MKLGSLLHPYRTLAEGKTPEPKLLDNSPARQAFLLAERYSSDYHQKAHKRALEYLHQLIKQAAKKGWFSITVDINALAREFFSRVPSESKEPFTPLESLRIEGFQVTAYSKDNLHHFCIRWEDK